MPDPAERIYERLLLLRCQAGDAVEDQLQEVWFDVFRGLGGLLDLGAFPAWVYRIARDRAARRLRRRQLPREAVKDVGELEADDAEEFSADAAARIHAAMGELPPEQREVLLLRFLEEMSYENIARVVGDPVGTVRSRLHYAKRALRTILERTD